MYQTVSGEIFVLSANVNATGAEIFAYKRITWIGHEQKNRRIESKIH